VIAARRMECPCLSSKQAVWARSRTLRQTCDDSASSGVEPPANPGPFSLCDQAWRAALLTGLEDK